MDIRRELLMRTLHRFAREVGGRVRYDESVLAETLANWEIGDMETLANLSEPDRRAISLQVLDALKSEPALAP